MPPPQIFFVVPSAMAFRRQRRHYRRPPCLTLCADGTCGDSPGRSRLLASTLGRSTPRAVALRDTRTPLRFAIVRVVLTTALGYVCAMPLPRWLGIAERWGVAGLTASAGVAGWIEMLLLRRTLNARIGRTGLPASYVMMLWLAAASGAATAWAIKLTVPRPDPIIAAIVILGPYGAVFFAIALALGIPEASAVVKRLTPGRKRQSG